MRVPCGNRTRLARLEAWHLCRSAKGTFTAAAAGIEPATGRLTVAFPYQHGNHRINKSGRLDLNQRSRAPEARAVFPGNTGQTFPRPEIKSAQRELNPHFRPGKTARCRYIMGAIQSQPDCQRSRAPGRTRTGVPALRVRSLGR